MSESEVVKLPTAQLRESVESFVEGFYTSLHSYLPYYLIAIGIILIIILILVLRTSLLKYRAKKLKPESTNNWFSWEDFYKWQEDQKK